VEVSSERLRVGFLMDPLERVAVNHDTTFALMLATQARGHAVVCFEQQHLFHDQGRPAAVAREVEVQPVQGVHFRVVAERVVALDELDVLWLRKDPPVDDAFIHATQLVEATGQAAPLLINSPAGLRGAAEHLWALRFPELSPPTLVSCDLAQLKAFVEAAPAGAVLKPVEGHAGEGVVLLQRADRNTTALLELYTRRGTQWAMLQHYLPEARAGDKRILVLDGEPLGAVLRVPRDDDHRGNMAAGAQPVRTTLSARDREVCARIAPDLRAAGLLFVGLDVIGGWLTEVNVTSPTGLVEIARLDGTPLADQVVAHVEREALRRGVGRESSSKTLSS
jgi:glutathione synthase